MRTSSNGQAGSGCAAQHSFLVSFSPLPSAPLATVTSGETSPPEQEAWGFLGPRGRSTILSACLAETEPRRGEANTAGREGGALDGGPARAFPGGKFLARAERVGGRPPSAWKESFLFFKKAAPRLTGKVHGMMDQLTQTAPWLPGREAKKVGFLF